MKKLIPILTTLILSCTANSPTEKEEQFEPIAHSYELFYDSLYLKPVPTAEMDNRPFRYTVDQIFPPDNDQLFHFHVIVSTEDNVDSCGLLNELLYCPDDTNWIHWDQLLAEDEDF